MSKFICAATPIRDEAYCLESYLSMVDKLFDGLVVVLDDRTVDNSEEMLNSAGALVYPTTFVDFGQMGNELLSRCRENGFEYAFILNPDEKILQHNFYNAVEFVKQHPSVELFIMARHNWYDLEMTDERTDVFPDWQCKIVKLANPNIRYYGKVHETISGARRVLSMPINITAEHFNLYYYKTGQQNYEQKIEQYNRLAQR